MTMYEITLLVLGGLALVGLVLVWILDRPKGSPPSDAPQPQMPPKR